MARPVPRKPIAVFAGGMIAGAALLWIVQQAPPMNWRSVAPPLAHAPLVIRKDVKGDGHFGAPRSGNLMHRGVDLEAPVGSSVLAIRSGRVVETGRHRGRGLYIEVEHAGNLRSLYAHLQTIDVSAGERVHQGQRLGTVGKTGNARHPWITPHLHLEVSRNGALIDPAQLGLVFLEPTHDTANVDAVGGDGQ